MTRTYPTIGVQIPQLTLPKPGIDLTKWAVVACDQFTCEPEYWAEVQAIVGDSPSSLRLILPEIYLGAPDEAERIRQVHAAMQDYLARGLLEPYEGLFYVERRIGKQLRKGLLLCLDLEQYDFNKGSQSLIRATEGTILERLPPRMRIREQAALELPHILVLIDDPDGTVIEPLAERAAQPDGGLLRRYNFELMLDSGRLAGYQVVDPQVEAGVIRALEALADPATLKKKYGLEDGQPGFLFAMGDGNHSLATAKAVWEKLKPQVGMEHPARYALVEVENVHDEGLAFEPIHRVLFDLRQDVLEAMRAFFGAGFTFTPEADPAGVVCAVAERCGRAQVFGLFTAAACGVVEIEGPRSNLAVGTLQAFLDNFLKAGGAGKIDYVHGEELVARLGRQPGCAGFYLPCMDKHDLFKTVILDGALPRKTFSMGEAREKRFYLESRRIET